MAPLIKILFIFTFILTSLFSFQKDTVKFSKEEKQWIQDNPLIKVAVMSYWNSDNYGNNKHKDFLQLLNNYGNLNIIPVSFDTWKSGFDKTVKGEIIHGIMNLSYSKDREKKYFHYSLPYDFDPNYLIVRKTNNSINSINDLKNKTIYIKQKAITKKIIEDISKDIAIVELKNDEQMYKYLSSKKQADTILAYAANKSDLDRYNLKLAKKVYNKYSQIYIGTSKKHKSFQTIINKIIKIVPKNELLLIQNKVYEKNSQKVSEEVSLSLAEYQWIKKNPIVDIIKFFDEPPFTLNKYKKEGYVYEIIEYLLDSVGLRANYVDGFTSYDSMIDSLDKGKVNILTTFPTSLDLGKESNIVKSKSILKTPFVLIGKRNKKNIQSIDEIYGLKVAVVKGYMQDKYLSSFPKIKKVYVNNNDEGFDAVRRGKAQYYINNRANTEYILSKSFSTDLKIVYELSYNDFPPLSISFAMNKEKKVLVSILDKALEQMPYKEVDRIKHKWIMDSETQLDLNFTRKEKIWIDKEIPIRYVYDPDWAPFEWKNEVEKHSGMISDILNIIALRSGVELVAVNVNKWSDAVNKAKNREIDMYSGVNKTIEKLTYMNFSKKSIYQTPYVFVTRLDDTNDYFETFKAINDKKVAVVDGYAIEDTLKKENPKFPLISVDSVKDGFFKLQNKEIDVFIINAATAKYYMNRLGFDDLRIATKTKYNLDLKIAIRKDWPKEVLSIIDKAMESITQKELDDIYHKWTEIVVEEKTDWILLLEMLTILLLVIGFILYNNKQLKVKVDKKTAEIKALLKSFDKNVIASKTDKEGRIVYVSEAFCEISGYMQEELIGLNHRIVRHPDMSKDIFKEMWTTIKKDEVWKGEVKNKKKDGGFYWVEVIITPECDSEGEFCGYSAIRQDITAKKEVENLSATLEQKVELRTNELNNERKYTNAIMNSQTNIVISSDGECLKSANKAFFDFFNINDINAFIRDFGDCICDTFDTKSPLEFIQKQMNTEKWLDYVYRRPDMLHKVKIIRNNKEHIFTITADKFTFKDKELKTAVFTNITEMENAKKEIERILSNILLPVLITSKNTRKILYANKYAQTQYEMPLEYIIGSDIDDIYTIENQQNRILEIIKKDGYVENLEETFKTAKGKKFTALLSVTPISYQNEESFIGMITDITKQKAIENEVRAIHKHTRDSIEYASLIQGALIPKQSIMTPFFKDHFVSWIPKDTVGGDIWLFNSLRHDDECLLFCIDCTGHGVPGAFVTMIVKSIEREIISSIKKHPEFDISPAIIMGYFNKTMKTLLRQETKDSLSNAGWDGGIIYYNRRTQTLKFSGAETSLFYVDENKELKTIKGNRYSVGYKKCDANYEYKEIIIDVKEGMKFYCTTDGYLDQNGGEKDFPFGKKRFSNIIKQYHDESMADQQTVFLDEMITYENMIVDNDRNDDITLIAFEIGQKSNYIENTIQEIVKYEGVMTQNVIASCMDNIESKILNINAMAIVSTITIEYCQNMMNYSKDIVPSGTIEVQHIDKKYYTIEATNIIFSEDKKIIEPKLVEIQSLDKVGIKKRYRELRKSGANTHEKGGGIGLYEISKVSDSIEYEFKLIGGHKYYFTMKSIVKDSVK